MSKKCENLLNQTQILLITGVGGGIGQAALLHYLPNVKMVITASRHEENTIFSSEKAPANWKHYSMDLTHESNVIRLFSLIIQDFGHLDCVINTIGGSLFSRRIEDCSLDEFSQVLNVNLISAFLITREAIKVMKSNGPPGGNILHIVSTSTKRVAGDKGPYSIAKVGLARLIQYTATEIAQYNLRINGISPTYVFTERHLAEIHRKHEKTGKSESDLIAELVSPQLIKTQLKGEDLLPLLDLLITTKIITGQIYDCSLGEVLDF